MRIPDAFSPLRDSRFAWYYAGRFISTIGSVIAPIAVVFAVLDISDSATALGVVLAARMIPLIVFLLIGGVIADRMSRSLVMQLSHVLSAVTQGAVGLLLLTGVAEIWMIVVLEALNGTVSAFTFPAMQGIVPQVVPTTHIQQANAMLAFSRNGLAMIGPAVGTLLVVTVGSGWAVLIDACTWLVAAYFMTKVKLPAAMARSPIEAPSMLGDLRDGWSAFVSLTWVWVVVLAFGLLNAIHAGAWFTLGPFIAKDTIGIQAWGWVLGAEAAGLLVMTIVMMQWRLRYPVRAGMLGITALAAPILALGLHPSVLLLMVLAFVAGCGTEIFSIGWQTAYHQHIPNELLSRVASYDALGSFVAIPIGTLVYGPLAGVFSARDVLVVSGVLYVVIALVTLLSESVRNLPSVDPSVEPADSSD
ncbi:MAG: MFS transporter [Nocardioidaceae bacterium]